MTRLLNISTGLLHNLKNIMGDDGDKKLAIYSMITYIPKTVETR